MPANGLLLIAPVRAGMEESLRITLNRLGNDIRGVRTPEPGAALQINATLDRVWWIRIGNVLFRNRPAAPVRWTLLDGDRRLLMVSNYDGTWENYIDEFAEMILSGLDALWRSAPDYPRAGAQDVAALKQFLRRHQAPANVFYSAYPETSVLNLNDDLEFARWFGWSFRRLTAGRVPNEPGTRELSARP